METRYKFKCPECCSDDVAADGPARWNVKEQEWELVDLFDSPLICGDCGYESHEFDHVPVTHGFRVTQEIFTPENAADGEAGSHKTLGRNLSLRDALELVNETRTARVDGVQGVELSASDIAAAGWITVYNGMEYESGAHESRALHLPDWMTAASKRRVAQLMNAT